MKNNDMTPAKRIGEGLLIIVIAWIAAITLYQWWAV